VKRVLLVVTNDAFGRQIARWGEVLSDQGRLEPVIYLAAGYMARHFDGCRKRGITVILPEIDSVRQEQMSPVSRMVSGTITGSLRMGFRALLSAPVFSTVTGAIGTLTRTPRAVFSNILSIKHQIGFIRSLIRQYQIDAVVITESGPLYGAPLLIRVAHDEGIPVVTTPIDKESAAHLAENFSSNALLSLDRPINRFIGYCFPGWVIVHKDRRMVPVVPELLLALEYHRLSPPHPWECVGNGEDRILLDSEASLTHYLKEGIPRELMSVCGAPEHDIMYRALLEREKNREALFSGLGLPAGRPMILSPLVQSHYLSGRPECDFQDYDDMVEFWVRSVAAAEGVNVIVNLHPSHTYMQDKSRWKYIEQWGVRISDQDLATLIPLCDLYVAAGSSTIAWAVACGRPVISYDIYRWGLDQRYRSLKGVFSVSEQIDFTRTLVRLTTDPAAYSAALVSQQADSAYWGKIDGMAGVRLVDEIAALAKTVAPNRKRGFVSREDN
jgi:hypothetical protein